MPRAHRHIEPGRTYHVTHRCHDRKFLLKFRRDRDAYRAWLRQGLRRWDVRMLNYCITSNHVHLLVRADNTPELARFMQEVAGGMAQAYNLRKKRVGAFWSDRYHATMIEDGDHLWRCMRYIDLNMVRAGVVGHPEEWAWTGWHELMGRKRRNRLLDMATVLHALAQGEVTSFRAQYAGALAEVLASERLAREPWWSESVAVGSPGFVEEIRRTLLGDYTRRRLETAPLGPSGLVLREAGSAYAGENRPENRAIGPL